uniref:Uncharacterized protein n=1 Tax=Romanomermis culicivorax TaxID=13658 RepID=A0A915HNT0_ROMCU
MQMNQISIKVQDSTSFSSVLHVREQTSSTNLLATRSSAPALRTASTTLSLPNCLLIPDLFGSPFVVRIIKNDTPSSCSCLIACTVPSISSDSRIVGGTEIFHVLVQFDVEIIG